MNQQTTNFITTPSWKMDETFKLPTKHDMLQNIVHVFIGHHFPRRPNELDIIVTNSKQVQAGKFPIVISYCFLFGFWPNRIL
jgi:hypothetical protein